MPLTAIQSAVLKLIATHRSPDSYLAGASVIHKGDASPRFSDDLDIFHDLSEAVAFAAEQDVSTLAKVGYRVEWILRGPHIYKATVTQDTESIRIDWTTDSAFRFFPLIPDEKLGYRLHDVDVATNKVLAMAGRNEIRDLMDCLFLHKTYLSLGAMTWAACGKDEGYTPPLIINEAQRRGRFRAEELKLLNTVNKVDPVQIKREWCDAIEQATALTSALPPEELGCLYLLDGAPQTPDLAHPSFKKLHRHFGTVKGAWPTVIQPTG